MRGSLTWICLVRELQAFWPSETYAKRHRRWQWGCVVCNNTAVKILIRTWLFSRSIANDLECMYCRWKAHNNLNCNSSKSKQLYVSCCWNLSRVCVDICHLETRNLGSLAVFKRGGKRDNKPKSREKPGRETTEKVPRTFAARFRGFAAYSRSKKS